VPAEPCIGAIDIPEEALSAFLPGANVLQCIVMWCAELKWPTGEDNSGGISMYGLTANFVGTTGCVMPRKVAGKFQSKYLDPLLFEEAALLPHKQWDDVRILEMANLFCRKYLQTDLLPQKLYTKRVFLWGFGYKKTTAGFLNRPVPP